MHAQERVDAAVHPRHLAGDHAGGFPAHPRAAVALDGGADDAQLGQPGQQLPGKLRLLPVRVNDRQHLLLGEGAHPVPHGDLLGGQVVVEPEVVGGRGAGGNGLR